MERRPGIIVAGSISCLVSIPETTKKWQYLDEPAITRLGAEINKRHQEGMPRIVFGREKCVLEHTHVLSKKSVDSSYGWDLHYESHLDWIAFAKQLTDTSMCFPGISGKEE